MRTGWIRRGGGRLVHIYIALEVLLSSILNGSAPRYKREFYLFQNKKTNKIDACMQPVQPTINYPPSEICMHVVYQDIQVREDPDHHLHVIQSSTKDSAFNHRNKSIRMYGHLQLVHGFSELPYRIRYLLPQHSDLTQSLKIHMSQ